MEKCLNSTTFLWIKLFGWKEWLNRAPITLNSLPDLPPEYGTNNLFERFFHYWNIELSRTSKGNVQRLWLALFRTFQLEFSFLVFISSIFLVFFCSSYVFLIWLIRALENDEHYSTWQLIGIAFLLCFCAASSSFVGHTLEYGFNIIGMKYRNILTTAIYQKLQTMSLATGQQISFGTILTIITSDLFKFDEYFNQMIYILISPIGIFVLVCIAVSEIGLSATLIIALFILHLIIQFCFGYGISIVYKRTLNWSDKRNKYLSEFLEGIRLVKCYAWEHAVAATVKKIKKQELVMILVNLLIKSIANSLTVSFPLLLIMMVCLSVYVAFGGEITSSRIFGFSGLMFLYFRLFFQVNQGVIGISELRISINRVQKILLSPNRIFRKTYSFYKNELSSCIKVSDLTVGKNSTETPPFINNISFELQNMDKVSVIGTVGSGKSSLFLSLLNEMNIINGDFSIKGSCAYVPQEPWIVSTSIRDNIIYGRLWNKVWYGKVVSSCCLELDISNLPEGDQTVVGDRGITLSGGQKARINLARAVYADMDIYLLDDPLSSVDASVATQLFHMFTKGILSNKTIILATHQLQYVSNTDKVLLLEAGHLVTYGNYHNVKNHPKFEKFSQFSRSKPSKFILQRSYDRLGLSNKHISQASSVFGGITHEDNSTRQKTNLGNNHGEIKEEVTHFSKITFLMYLKYFWTGGNIPGILSLIAFSLTGIFGLIIGKNYYLVWWIMANSKLASNKTILNSTMLQVSSQNASQLNILASLSFNERIYFFILLCISVSIILIAASITYTWIPALASYKFHNRMLWRVLRARTSFFYSNTIGSIMNRFSKDISTMDHHLPILFYYYLHTCFYMLFTFIAALIAHWLTLVPCILLLAFLVLYRFQLVRTIRQLKRLESAAKSDVISHFSSTYHGLTTIHSLNLELYQLIKMRGYQDIHLNCWRVFYAYLRFFAFQVDVLIAVYGFCVAIILIVLRNDLSPIVSAFILSQVFTLLDQSQFTIRLSAEVEMNMVAVERVFDYIALPEEAPLHSKRNKAFQVTKGSIEFRNVQLSYSPEYPLVLKDISFQVQGGDKIGIIGRTGSGKTSLQNALLRLIELTSGSIIIDGVDIKELGLHELRDQISIIPQDPVLFSGSLRFTLDPFNAFTNDQLWKVLEEVELYEKVKRLKNGLNFTVSEGGSNFSVGERQLLCLARAMLKKCKILMLDEATSYIDTLTDCRIQHLLQSKFQKCTVLTIAHRIQTVMEYDQIMVMENGRIVEYDSPINLMSDKTSQFYQFVLLS